MEVWDLDSLEKARKVANAASDKQASNIVVLDLRDLTVFADFFVICSAGTDRQLGTVVDSVEEELGKVQERARQREGTPESGWVLLDFADVIVHVFAPDEREYYNLDEFWAQARRVLTIE